MSIQKYEKMHFSYFEFKFNAPHVIIRAWYDIKTEIKKRI